MNQLTHVWRWGRPAKGAPLYDPQRKGQRCRIRCRGRGKGPLNIAVEMADGELVCAPQYAVAPYKPSPQLGLFGGDDAPQEIASDRHRVANDSAGLTAKDRKSNTVEGARGLQREQPADEAHAWAVRRAWIIAELTAKGCQVTVVQPRRRRAQRQAQASRHNPEARRRAHETAMRWWRKYQETRQGD